MGKCSASKLAIAVGTFPPGAGPCGSLHTQLYQHGSMVLWSSCNWEKYFLPFRFFFFLAKMSPRQALKVRLHIKMSQIRLLGWTDLKAFA